jgi:D-alanyl-D-alanine carboxypeptidase
MSFFARSLLQSAAAVVALTLFFAQPALAAETATEPAAETATEPTVVEHEDGGWWRDRDGWDRHWWNRDDNDGDNAGSGDGGANGGTDSGDTTDSTGNDNTSTDNNGGVNEWSDNQRGEWSDLTAFAANNAGEGFWVLTKEGEVFALGGAPDLGTPTRQRPLVAMASHPTRAGFWVLDKRGGVQAFGAAKTYGSATVRRAVGMAVPRSGRGYWIATTTGKVASFGKAKHFGDLRRFDVQVDRIVAREEADGYYLRTTSDRWIEFPNDWWRPRPDRDRPDRDHDRPSRDREPRRPTRPQPNPPKVTNPRRSGEVRVATVGGITVARAIADNLRRLLAKSRRDGGSLGGWGYRSRARQIELRRAHCGRTRYAIYEKPSSQCSPPTARPGHSMHEQGRAIDFYKKGGNGAAISIAGTREFRWLKNNARRFGFYNLPSEPWHWSTNGN